MKNYLFIWLFRLFQSILLLAWSGASQTSSANPTECLFNWAEIFYPALFSPAGSPTAAYGVYTNRYYSTTQAYLGVSSIDNHVYYQGSDGKPQDVGPQSYWNTAAGCQASAMPTACLFNWAESHYPALFAPSGSPTATPGVYTYRYYSATHDYLGVSSIDNHVYYQGSDGQLQDVGPLSYWLPVANCLQVSPTVYENTTRSGPINSNEIWKGVIDITGDVSIYSPATVTIEPGTIIRFSANSDDQHGGGNAPIGSENTPITDSNFPSDPRTARSEMSSIGVFGGTLYAVGTPDHTITFTSSDQKPKAGDWHSLQYNRVKSKLILQYTTIEYAYYGVEISETATDSDVTLKNNVIRNIVACGICTGGHPLRPVTITIANNDISYCGHEGVDTHSNATVIIENNAFHDNFNGVILDTNESIIRENQFIRNTSFAIYITNPFSHPSIYGNTFIDNKEDCSSWPFAPPFCKP
jgi:hypothetical protein